MLEVSCHFSEQGPRLFAEDEAELEVFEYSFERWVFLAGPLDLLPNDISQILPLPVFERLLVLLLAWHPLPQSLLFVPVRIDVQLLLPHYFFLPLLLPLPHALVVRQ